MADKQRPDSYFYTTLSTSPIYLPVIPDSISDSTKADWNSKSILGRSVPIAAYNYTNAREVSFSFEMFRDPNEDNVVKGGYVDKALVGLRALLYPKYSTNGVEVPITTFVFADFRSQGYVSSVNFNWKRPVIYNNTKYGLVEVSVSMTEIVSFSAPDNEWILGRQSIPANPFVVGES